MADVRISALPTAQSPISGDELVPIVQNGLTVQTTVSAITQSPSLTQTFLTVGQQPQLPNSRYIATGTGLGFTDGGAQSPYTLALNGTAGSLEGASTGVIVKTAPNTIAARTLSTSGNGISVSNGSGVSGNPTFQLTGVAQALANASGTGLLALGSGSTISPVTIVGTTDQITVSGGNGTSNPTIGIASNPIIPGTAAVKIPVGTTAERSIGSDGEIRFNSQTGAYEAYASGVWRDFSLTGGVLSFSAGTTGFAPSSPTAGVVTLSGVLNSTSGGTGASALTGYLYGNGASPATASTTIPTTDLSGTISNAQLANSGFTINGTAISLGGSGTITAASPNALTISTGLSGTTYTGATPVTIAIANTGVFAGSYGSATAVPVIAVNAQGQLTSASSTPIAIPSSAITDKGMAGGVASLDGSGTVPVSQLPAAVLGTLSYQGTWNASTNTPTLTSSVGTKGYYYVVNVAGTTNLNGITDWQIGDWAVFNGTAWQKIDNTDAVTSVNGYTGTVVLTAADVGAPTTSGTGATGTWAINISGNAATSTSSTTATNIAGGAANQIPYQTGAGATTFSPNLTFNGTTLTNTGNAIISDNSTNAALRITQTGTGNALLVEDSASPDATPVVIDNSGYLVVGHTGRLTTTNTGQIQSVVTAAGNAFNAIRFSSTTSGSEFNFAKSDSDTIGTNTVVASGDTIGSVSFSGADGTNYIRAAQISAVVDGTPGTNDMPGRLVFSTTADGASSPTERMRIDSAGRVGIGGTPALGTALDIGRNPTGSTTYLGVFQDGLIQSDVTTEANYNYVQSGTQAASFSTNIIGYRFAQGSFGAGSTVTNQYGFYVNNLFSATNNYGFYSNIASGTGRWNFYAAGTAANVFAGTTHIGGTVGAESLRVTNVASAVNYLQAAGATTGNAATLSAQGSDANIDLSLTPKGTGVAKINTTTSLTLPVGTTAQRPTPAAGMLRFNDDTDEFEGYNGTAWSSVGGSAISNDTSTATSLYPLFANATTGTAANVYTSNAKLLYTPSTGEFQSTVLNASNGIVVNSATIAINYTVPNGSNAMSAGPVTINAGITVTVASGSVWTIV